LFEVFWWGVYLKKDTFLKVWDKLYVLFECGNRHCYKSATIVAKVGMNVNTCSCIEMYSVIGRLGSVSKLDKSTKRKSR